MNKTLHIPYTPALDNLSLEEVANALEDGGARFSVESLNWPGEFPYRPLTVITAAHSGKFIYLDFLVRCNYLRAVNYADQSPVSEDSCVEVFLQCNEGGDYWNFEFNCIGAVNASHRIHRPEPTRLTSEELASIRRFPTCGTKPFCEVEGLFTWNLLVVIPLKLLGIDTVEPGTILRGNFYKCASAASQPHFLSWNPIDTPAPDFHRPEFFGNLILQ